MWTWYLRLQLTILWPGFVMLRERKYSMHGPQTLVYEYSWVVSKGYRFQGVSPALSVAKKPPGLRFRECAYAICLRTALNPGPVHASEYCAVPQVSSLSLRKTPNGQSRTRFCPMHVTPSPTSQAERCPKPLLVSLAPLSPWSLTCQAQC